MRLFSLSIILLLAWGALAMGGAPSWAGAPVAVLALTTGILGFLERRDNPLATKAASNLPHWSVSASLCLLLTAIVLQLVPLPASMVTTLSPAHELAEFERLLATADRRDSDLVPATAEGSARPLSIAPGRTWWGLGFAAAFGFYLIGTSAGLSAVGVTGVARSATVLGAIVASIGIHYVATGSRLVYGLYAPLAPTGHAAPFMNRNHQAGWLVMVMSLAAGLFLGEVARGIRTARPNWRERILWFSSKQANASLLLLFVCVLMGVGVLATRSRSGAATFVLALLTLIFWAGRRQSSKVRRVIVMGGLAAIVLIAFFVNGSGVAERIADTSWFTMDGRIAAWEDSLRALRDFWLVGTGFNTYGVSMLHYQTTQLESRLIEAHNDYLQYAVEGGWLLGIPGVLLIASLAMEIRRRFREATDDTRTYWIRIGAVTGLLAIAVQSTVEFTLQMPGAAVMFATLLAIAIHRPRPRMASSERHGK